METLNHINETENGIHTQAPEVEVDGEVVVMSIPDRIMANIQLRTERDMGKC